MNDIISLPGLYQPASALFHLIGSIVFLLFGFRLFKHAKINKEKFFILIFILSGVACLSISGIYHSLPHGESRQLFLRLDHAAIFILIAGSYTVLHNLIFKGTWNHIAIIVMWVFAFAGVFIRIIYFSDFSHLLNLSLYLFQGWLGVVSAMYLCYKLRFDLGKAFKIGRLVVYGGIAYTVGALIDFIDPPMVIPGIIGSHELFHIAVLVGIGFHWRFIANHYHQLATRLPLEGASRVALKVA